MALDTYLGIAGKVLLRCPLAGPLLARDWVSNSFRRAAERRPWSWLIKQGQFITMPVYNTGTVTTVQNSTTVTGLGTVFTVAMIGRQFRLTTTTPIYTIVNVDIVLQTLTLDLPWGSTAVTGSGYEIYTAYASPPSDFNYFLTVWDPNFNWQLHTGISQRELNAWDAQRSNRGQAYLVAPRDYYIPTGETVPLPRFEIWPHVTSAYVLPFLYIARATDLQDTGSTLPRYIRGDLLLEMALAEAAKWPGPSDEKVNPYFNLKLAQIHEAKVELMLSEAERQDEEISIMNVQYDTITRLPWAPLPMDASFWQKHAI
jgi:hypothetical protein